MGIFKKDSAKDNIKLRYLAEWDSAANASFGTIADNICWNVIENSDEKVYLVTSASLKEGKTTVAINLVLHIAKRGKKVLLIDANLRNPTIGEIFSTGSLPGLTQLICNGMSIPDLVFPVEEYNIQVVPSGKIDHEPFEVLASPKIAEIFDQAKKLYDFVIIDCTAVNFYADPLLLCPSVDRVIFVVLADKTEKSKVLNAKARILNAEGKILGVVLNRRRHSFLQNGGIDL